MQFSYETVAAVLTISCCPESVQKNFKKTLTLNLPSGIVAAHTVTYRYKMRTKTLLLSAAAIAAGIISSQAQSNVYSANIVGYVTTVFSPAGNYTLVANPLDSGSNNVVSMLDSVLPNKSQVLVWDTPSQGFITATKIAGAWNTNVALPVGGGFFVKTPTTQAAPITNTFVGNIIVSPNGGTNNVNLPAAYVLSGSAVPFTGNINDYQTGATNTINLGGVLPNKSQVLAWDVPSQGFITATKIAGAWNTNLAIVPAQGFYIKSSAATNWVQTLSVQ